ncbi:MAG TPA: hypothetical protein ENH52_05130 [Nitrospirae bacterium]|nr:hypothetical protein [Nitrospirota bacterium]
MEGWRVGELESWRVGELESWRVGGLEGWRVGELGSWGVEIHSVHPSVQNLEPGTVNPGTFFNQSQSPSNCSGHRTSHRYNRSLVEQMSLNPLQTVRVIEHCNIYTFSSLT